MNRQERFETYYNMAFERLQVNPDQAYLCLQNAYLYCDEDAIKNEIADAMSMLNNECDIHVRNTAIVIASYNACYLQQKNIQSIRETLLGGTYQIIVVDNGSTDGIAEWLEEQPDVVLVKNTENLGFPVACNQGVLMTTSTGYEDADIFLLNNDTRLSLDSLFWLKMGLYENDRIGATGSYSNYAGNEQQLELAFNLPIDYLEYGNENNIPMDNPYEEKVRLSGFSMLVRRKAWDAAGGMDEQFSPGYFEDDDLCMKLSLQGYKFMLCKNSFVYHAGSQSFSKKDNVNQILDSHRELFKNKYGFDIIKYGKPRYRLISQINRKSEESFNVLIVGGGLGADAKYIKSIYKNANIFSVEPDEGLYNISRSSEAVCMSSKDLKRLVGEKVFDVLIFSSDDIPRYLDEEIDTIISLCKDSCQIIKGNMTPKLDLATVKLIIWDMDDTFWDGTISEEDVHISPIMVQLIKDLTECGIINSISSKNDADVVNDKLKEYGIDDLFVFNNINWYPKGAQIATKIKDMNLRNENVLFIDDNVRNLEEVKHYCDGVMVSLPEIIPELASFVNKCEKKDKNKKRLKQYRILEEKLQVKEGFASTEDFLFESDIRICIDTDCNQELNRITELVSRTNQLNFTKVRDEKEALAKYIDDEEYECAVIRVNDKFGDYGIAGFYCLDKQDNRLVHFVFSCRIMGMGIEQYVYSILNYPQISIASPVVVSLSRTDRPLWVKESIITDSVCNTSTNKNGPRVLLKGPCDLDSIALYLDSYNVEGEFNYINSLGFVTTGQNHSMHIREMATLSTDEISDILADAPFLVRGDFQSSIFSEEYDIICYSLLPDCHAGLYKNRSTGSYISFGSRNFDLTDKLNMEGYISGEIVNHGYHFTENIIEDFAEKWEFVGVTSIEDIIRNLDYIYNNVLGSPRLILLLGSEIEYEGINLEFASHAPYHREVNAAIMQWALDKDRIFLINSTDYIKSQEDYIDCINHYSRDIYYQMANDIKDIINE